jgi:serine/threonine-protein kinase
MLKPGVLLEDQYEVWGRIGGGGMSDVWLARHTGMATPLVIKTLKSTTGAHNDERRERLMREARLTARVRCHRIVRPLDVGEHDGIPYLVQEYVDGIDLEELAEHRLRAQSHGLPLWFVCEVLADAAQGLHSAHQTGILHRDVKPSNLFFSPEEGTKLGDFGIAQHRNLSSAGELCGTLSFMAPEVLRGESVDRRSDLFAFGATGYCLRYGRPPFDTPAAVLAAEPLRPPPPMSPEEAYFQQVIARAMAPARELRPSDLNEPRRQLHALSQALRKPLRALLQPDGSLQVGATRLSFEVGDISFAACDAIICPANPQLSMEVGVAGALQQQGGPGLELEAQAGGPRPLGSCVVTGPGRLRCRKVLHAVSAWREASCIARTALRSLLVAEEHGLQRLAVPALGTGVAGVALEASANAIGSALRVHLELGGSRLREVRFVLYDEAKLQAFREVILCLFLGSSDERPVDLGLPGLRPQVSAEALSVDDATIFAR